MAPVATAMTATSERFSPCAAGTAPSTGRAAGSAPSVVAIGSGYRRTSPARLLGRCRVPLLDVAAASALGGDAGQRGDYQGYAQEGEPDAEDHGEDGDEGAHPHDEGPDGRAGEGVDGAGAVSHLGVVTILGTVARSLD